RQHGPAAASSSPPSRGRETSRARIAASTVTRIPGCPMRRPFPAPPVPTRRKRSWTVANGHRCPGCRPGGVNARYSAGVMLQRLVHLLPPRVRAGLRRIPVHVALCRWLRRGELTRERHVFAALAALAVAIGFATANDTRGLAPSGILVLIVIGGGL